jgi:hypothetical protein
MPSRYIENNNIRAASVLFKVFIQFFVSFCAPPHITTPWSPMSNLIHRVCLVLDTLKHQHFISKWRWNITATTTTTTATVAHQLTVVLPVSFFRVSFRYLVPAIFVCLWFFNMHTLYISILKIRCKKSSIISGTGAAIWSKTNFGPIGHHHPGSSSLTPVCTTPMASVIF